MTEKILVDKATLSATFAEFQRRIDELEKSTSDAHDEKNGAHFQADAIRAAFAELYVRALTSYHARESFTLADLQFMVDAMRANGVAFPSIE